MASSNNTFTCIKTEGSILPTDLLTKIASGHTDIDGLKETDYYLVEGEKLSETISRSWNRLQTLWDMFNVELEKLPENNHAIGLTRSKWLLPLFQELGYGQLQREKVTVFDGKEYSISHFYDHSPIHLVGCGINIDKRTPGAAGASRVSPHGLVQEFLNRSDDHLWAIVSNGFYLRILRDNVSLTRQAYVEFDLKAIMDGQVYSDFSLLWFLCHISRIKVLEGKTPEDCWLEKWSQHAIQQGTRVMEDLRSGVEKAISILGSGFLANRNNNQLRDKLRNGQLDKQDYYRQLLRIVYRLIFLFVSEDRDLLLLPDIPKETKETYIKYYSTRRLRNIAQKHKGTQHCDMYRGLLLIFEKLHKSGCPELGMPALGSFLWNPEFTKDICDCDITNRDLLEAIRSLAYTVENQSLRQIDYKNLGSEELGSVYESLLELHPELYIPNDSGPNVRFELSSAAGHERKTTGSYYTPTSLITCLLDSALDPVIDATAKKESPEKAILNLKICDPACGSGHFLVAAAHRIAKRLASVRCGEEEPSPDDTRKALRDVISHCIYGVDINPMSVELCKISLWLEAIEPGKPLSFLDHHIKCGNSLLGTSPALMENGIPDEAFKPIEGDIKAICSDWKKQNKDERKGQDTMFSLFDDGREYLWDKLGTLSTAYNKIEEFSDDDISSRRQKEKQYEEFVKSSSYEFGHLLADAWSAAFVIEKSKKFSYGITEKIYREIEKNPHSLAPWLKEEIKHLARQYQFSHWHLEFPSVFKVPGKNEPPENEQTGLIGGFDCVLGNPPWERIKLQEKEFFASVSPEIANAPNAAKRRALIAKLPEINPELYQAFVDAKRKAEGESHLVRDTNYFPLCGRGDVNTYSIFAELKYNLMSPTGRVGCIVPSGIATDDTTKFFFQNLMDTASLHSLFIFENERRLFPGIDHRNKFALMTMTGQNIQAINTDFVFGAYLTSELSESNRHFSLSANDISLLNPNTRTCPIFRSKTDAELTKYTYHRVPVLINESNPKNGNPWGISFMRMFDMANDSYLFRTREELESADYQLEGNIFSNGSETFLPLYEGKMIHLYDCRFGTYQGQTRAQANQGKLPELTPKQHAQSNFYSIPRYWVSSKEVNKRCGDWKRHSFISFRDVTNAVVLRTAIFSLLPLSAVGHKAPLMLTNENTSNEINLLSSISSYIFDYLTRQSLGGVSMSYFVLKQLPVLKPEIYTQSILFETSMTLSHWLLPRVLELTYTAWDLQLFAKDCGYDGPPFVWDEERRFKIRAELDAVYFHLYLGTEQEWKEKGSKELLKYFPTPRSAVEYIMETFPIAKRKDIARTEVKDYSGKVIKEGCYHTKELILEIYDKMAEAIVTGTEYKTILNPPAADPSVAHPWPVEKIQKGQKVVVPPSYPATELEMFVFAASLATVGQIENISRKNHLDAIILLFNSDICLRLLSAETAKKYRTAIANLSVPEVHDENIGWRQAIDYLKNMNAISQKEDFLSKGSEFDKYISKYSYDFTSVLPGIIEAAQIIHESSEEMLLKAEIEKLQPIYDKELQRA